MNTAVIKIIYVEHRRLLVTFTLNLSRISTLDTILLANTVGVRSKNNQHQIPVFEIRAILIRTNADLLWSFDV